MLLLSFIEGTCQPKGATKTYLVIKYIRIEDSRNNWDKKCALGFVQVLPPCWIVPRMWRMIYLPTSCYMLFESVGGNAYYLCCFHSWPTQWYRDQDSWEIIVNCLKGTVHRKVGCHISWHQRRFQMTVNAQNAMLVFLWCLNSGRVLVMVDEVYYTLDLAGGQVKMDAIIIF